MMSDYYFHERFRDYDLNEPSDFETEEESQAYYEAEMARLEEKYTVYCPDCGERVDNPNDHQECGSDVIC